VDRAYYQLFCGEECLRRKLTFDRPTLTRRRQRMDEERLAALIQESFSVDAPTAATSALCTPVNDDGTLSKLRDRPLIKTRVKTRASVGSHATIWRGNPWRSRRLPLACRHSLHPRSRHGRKRSRDVHKARRRIPLRASAAIFARCQVALRRRSETVSSAVHPVLNAIGRAPRA
jgi:hypothetical protein